MTLGLLILLFVAYQLWGTGIVTARAQDDMRAEFNRSIATTTTTIDARWPRRRRRPRTATDRAGRSRPAGDWIGTIKIPKIGVDKIFVEGTGRDDLKKGPGHYPGTPLPGQVGNAAIAGHRTTYGQPFFDLDQLDAGDEIVTTSVVGHLHVRRHRQAHRASRGHVRRRQHAGRAADAHHVQPEVLGARAARHQGRAGARPSRRCRSKPRRCEARRPPTGRRSPKASTGESKPLGPAYGWGAIVAAVGVAWWWLFRRWRHPATWLAGVVPFLIVLFGFYYFLERVLPAGY